MENVSALLRAQLLCAVDIEVTSSGRYPHALSFFLHCSSGLLVFCDVIYHLRKKRQDKKPLLMYLPKWHTVRARFLKELLCLCGTSTGSGAVRNAEQSVQMPAEIWLIVTNTP